MKTLRPWLEEILNKHEVPGVEWIDKEKSEFRVPWKKQNSPDWKERDGELFKVGCFTLYLLTLL
jgi:hypothetical protein